MGDMETRNMYQYVLDILFLALIVLPFTQPFLKT